MTTSNPNILYALSIDKEELRINGIK